MRPNQDPDATMVIRRVKPRARPRNGWGLWTVGGVVAGALLAVGIWLVLRPPASAPNPPGSLPEASIAAATEDQLLALPADHESLWRFADDPAILVAIFPSLHAQALALDRVAEFVERAGAPHDRVLDDTALRAAIKAAGDDFDTVYYGHDYRAADLQRFFALAAQENIALNAQELALKAQLAAQGVLAPGADLALITLPPPTAQLDPKARRTILRHELSHGLYFTDASYRAYVRNFWRNRIGGVEQARLRAFLASEGYDTNLEDLVENEALAYLIHTRDPRFFPPGTAGISDQALAAQRAQFVNGMPDDWLKARTTP